MPKKVAIQISENEIVYEYPANVYIIVDDDNIDKALSKFKKIVKKANVLRTYSDKMRFKKPSDARREKRSLAKLRAQTQTRINNH